MKAVEASQSRRRDTWARYGPLLIIAAGLCAYANSYFSAFIFDDGLCIVDNQNIRHLWPLWDLVSAGRRPVVDVTLAINYAIGELDPAGYHVFNVVVHILAALTLYGVLRRSLPSERLGERYGASSSRMALTAALIWVVHPLLTQGVTYTIQRAESLMGLFFLLTLYCLIRAVHSPHRLRWYSAGVLTCLAGMGSKAVMVTAPVMLLIYDRIFLSASWAELWRRRWGLYLALAATWSVFGACGVVPGVLDPSAPHARVGFGFKGISPLTYALTQPGVILHYLRLSFWPHPLCIDYDWPPATSMEAIALPALAVAALIGLTFWSLRKEPRLSFLGIWFFLILAPTSSFIPIRDLAFEHRMYLPLASLVVLAVLLGRALWKSLQNWIPCGVRLRQLAPSTLVLVIVATLGGLTVLRNRDYRSDLTMWSDVVATRPGNVRARVNLAGLFIVDRRFDEAIPHLQEAIRIDPEEGDAHANLGLAFRNQRRYAEGVQALRRAAELLPRDHRVYYQLGGCLHDMGNSNEAREAYLQALKLNPTFPQVHYGLGRLFLEDGNTDMAMGAFNYAIQFGPDFADGYYGLGQALNAGGRTDDAIAAYRRALEINSQHVGARHALDALLTQGQSAP